MPLAQTGIRSSQSYPQEEDKSDDKEIHGRTLEDEDQGRQGQTAMGQAHDHDAVHSTKDGTVLMQATVLIKPQ
jgi:hypothetical protein